MKKKLCVFLSALLLLNGTLPNVYADEALFETEIESSQLMQDDFSDSMPEITVPSDSYIEETGEDLIDINTDASLLETENTDNTLVESDVSDEILIENDYETESVQAEETESIEITDMTEEPEFEDSLYEGDMILSSNAEDVSSGGMILSSRARRLNANTSSSFTGRYGDQLTGLGSQMYSLIESNWGSTGYSPITITIEPEITFEATMVYNEEKDKYEWAGSSDPNYTSVVSTELNPHIQSVYEASLYDFPELFWMAYIGGKPSIRITKSSSGVYTGHISKMEICGVDKSGKEVTDAIATTIQQFQTAISNSVTALQSKISNSNTKAENIMAIHDYVLDLCTYSTSNSTNSHNAYGAFCENGDVVCEGYAKAFKILCERFGYDCVMIGGKANNGTVTDNHAWNYVKIDDDAWYLIDTTWDDTNSNVKGKTYLFAGSNTTGLSGKPISNERSVFSQFSTSAYAYTFFTPTLAPEKYHESDIWETISEATCNSEGMEQAICSLCGDLTTRTIGKTDNHVPITDKAVEATCQKTGLTEGSHCSVCGAVIVAQETVPKKEHTVVEDKAVKATCEHTGLTAGTHCSVCNEVLTAQEVIPLADHTVVIDKAVEATCEHTGLTEGSHCSVCGKVIVKQETTPLTEHTAVIDKRVDATCEHTGLTEGSHCSVCNKVLTAQEVIPLAEHTPVTDNAVNSTCEHTGLTEGSHCSVCGKVLVEQKETPMKSHAVVTDKAVEATCTKTGLTKGSHCSVCGKVIKAQEIVSAKGHTTVVDEAVAPTEDTDGLTEGSHCSVCGEVIKAQEVVPRLSHTHTVVTDKAVEATCKHTGLTEGSHCSSCGAVIKKQEVVPKKSHTVVTDKAVNATCTETGLTQGSHCSVCGEVIKAQEVVPAKGHTAVTDKAVAPTEDTDGLTEGSHCSVCGEIIKAQEVIPRLSHTHTVVIDKAVEATCEHTGLTQGSHCSACGKVIEEQQIIQKKPHTTVTDKAVEATCEHTGLTEGSHCSVCGTIIKKQTVTAKKAHEYGEWKTIKNPTCENTGTRERICKNCKTNEQETIPCLDHSDYRWVTTINATCKDAGKKEYRCGVCGKATKTEAIPATGHTYGSWTVVHKATALAEGKMQRTCSVCGNKETKNIPKLSPYVKLSYNNIKLKVKQSTSVVKVTKMAFGDGIAKWSSSNSKIATVTQSGKIKGKKKGTCYITVTMKSGATASCKVSVQKKAVSASSILTDSTNIYLNRGESVKLNISVNPVTCIQKIKFSSSNKKIASVSKSGVIKAKKKGKAKITVRVGKKKKKITVTVY